MYRSETALCSPKYGRESTYRKGNLKLCTNYHPIALVSPIPKPLADDQQKARVLITTSTSGFQTGQKHRVQYLQY